MVDGESLLLNVDFVPFEFIYQNPVKGNPFDPRIY